MTRLQRSMLRPKMLRLVLPVILVVIGSVAYLFFTSHARNNGEAEIAKRAADTLKVQTEAILAQLDKYRYLPSVIALQPEIIELTRTANKPGNIDALKSLQRIQANSGSLSVSVFRPDGEIIVQAGNYFLREKKPPIDAELIRAPFEGRLGRASVNNVSDHRAYAFSSAVRDNGTYVGFVLVVAPIEAIERAWALSGKPVFATNERDQIVAKDFQAEELVEPMIANGTLGSTIMQQGLLSRGSLEYRVFSQPIALLGWRLHVLERFESVKTAQWQAGIISILGSALGGLLIMLAASRMRQRILRERLEKANALRLERKVDERTSELVRTNRLLEVEITERQQAEARLRKTQKELVQAGKLAGLGQMSAALSHEFNQPLAAIKSYADNARQYLSASRTEEASENVKHILELTDRMAAISKHLRNFARRPQEKTIPVDVASVISDAVEIMNSKLKSSRSKLQIDIPDDIPRVRAGQVRLQQVFVNLLSNAIDAQSGMSEPRIEITAEKSGNNPGDRIVISVRDHGEGFSNEVLEKMFDPFFTTKGVNRGLGLGLSISYNIISDFGGSLMARNAEDGGAILSVSLERWNEKERAASGSEQTAVAAQ